ncbi:phosphotransferase family protein [Streptomyces sp. NPDC021224]|uniref:phosphotransferase family protein n=1 Tax=unclassified Streptomyces TaxID=2593676 RepID=UPI0037AFB776
MNPPNPLTGLHAALSDGTPDRLLPWYTDGTVLESHLFGKRYRTVGAGALAAVWPAVSEGAGEITSWSVVQEKGGAEIDVQRARPGGDAAAVRQRHALHLDGAGRIVRHTVYAARARGTGVIPAIEDIGLAGGEAEEWATGGWSGSRLYQAHLAGGEPVVVKHLSPTRDWMMRATDDPGREALLFAEGVYQRVPATLRSTPIAVREVPDGWVVVMRDVSAAHAAMAGSGSSGAALALTALHDLHRTFRGKPVGDYLCSIEDRLTLLSPMRSLIEGGRREILPSTITPMWETWTEHGDPDLVEAVLRLARKPEPLLKAIAEAGEFTLLHGDYQPSNLALDDEGVIALDWSLACYGPPEVDFVWFLSNTAWGDDDERDHLVAQWTGLTGVPAQSRALDLATVFHAVMGELAFLTTERIIQPEGFAVPSAATVGWWARRVRTALDRTGLA